MQIMTNTLNISATDRCKIASIIMENEDFVAALRSIGEYYAQKGDIVNGILFTHAALNINMHVMYCRYVKPHTLEGESGLAKHVTFEIPHQNTS